jgi:hypothetical protein
MGSLWIVNPQCGCHDDEIGVLISFCYKLAILIKL